MFLFFTDSAPRSEIVMWPERYDVSAEEDLLSMFRTPPDAIVVLCGGNHLPPWSTLRFDAAVRIHNMFESFARGVSPTIVVSGGGSPHVAPWVVTEGAAPHVVHESTEGCEYIRGRGYAGPLMKEVSSYDTIGNAYFVRMLFVEPAAWTNIIVITSRWHMPRTQRIFDYVMGLHPCPRAVRLVFVATDDGAFQDGLEQRMTSERRSLDALGKILPITTQLKDFHGWLNLQHQQYDEYGPKERESQRTREQNSLY